MRGLGRIAGTIALACASACATGSESPTVSSAFDPTNTASDTEAGTTGGSSPGTTEIGSADETGPPPDGGCCQVSASPGCADPQIETCVCTIEPSCCQAVWNQDCVDLAGGTCNDPGCTEPPPATSGTSTGGDSTGSTGEPLPPTLTCEELADQENWENTRCEAGGGTQCNGMGTPTIDCDFCCELCGEPGDVSCGNLAMMQGWTNANCEWNGNGACNGIGTPTCDCNFCCEVG